MTRPVHLMLLLLVPLIIIGSPSVVVADVPTVLKVSANPIVDCGTPLAGQGFLILATVRHANPTTTHYVDKIEIAKGKSTVTIDLQPQSNETFTVSTVLCEGRDYHAGEELTVLARAHCTIHGWGTWSSSVTIPEFETPGLIALAALTLASLGVLLHKRRRVRHVSQTLQ
jgi:desulfoferrodoxin (superoxide reductase-like protein)